MDFRVRDNLTDAEVRDGLDYVVRDGIASQAMGILTGGAFLVAFAIQLGASNFTIGLLAAIGPPGSTMQSATVLSVLFVAAVALGQRTRDSRPLRADNGRNS